MNRVPQIWGTHVNDAHSVRAHDQPSSKPQMRRAPRAPVTFLWRLTQGWYTHMKTIVEMLWSTLSDAVRSLITPLPLWSPDPEWRAATDDRRPSGSLHKACVTSVVPDASQSTALKGMRS